MKAVAPGAKIADRYVLESVIAKGGMGAVYRATDERLGRTVAIKVLLAELAEDATSITRFEREASAMARLTHPGIVQVFDFGKHDGVPYIVMEHVVGRTLATELDTLKRLAPHRACDIVEQALLGVVAAHAAGIVHRDLKPGNIMIVPTGTGAREVVKVLDFGIAQLKESVPYVRLTNLGAVLGTPTFMSPEQVRGETSDPRTDVYAMGVVLWCCLTGQRPFQAPDVPGVLARVLGEMPPRADKIDPSIPIAIAHATERAMAKRLNARFATATDFARALADAREQSAIPPTSVSPLPQPRIPAEAAASSDARTRPSSRPPRTAATVQEMPSPVAAGASVPTTRAGIARPPWQRVLPIAIGIALFIGVVLGGLVVAGVIEYQRAGVDLPDLPTPEVPAIAPSAPSPTTLQPVSRGGAAESPCDRLPACCEAYRSRVEPSLTDCSAYVAELAGDQAACAERIALLQRGSADATGRVPPECR